MHRIAICDDDAAFAQDTASCVREWCGQHGFLAEVSVFADGDALVAAASQKSFDVVFLDMIMPLVSGMDTARELRLHDRKAHIVFLTSSPEFALESYEVKASDYLLKPVSHERLCQALDEWRETVTREPRSMVVRTSAGYQRVDFEELEYVEARGKRALLALAGREVDAAESFGGIEEKLASECEFFRCHRSYLVNLSAIDHFDATELFTRQGRCVPVARTCKKAFQDAYFAYRFRS